MFLARGLSAQTENAVDSVNGTPRELLERRWWQRCSVGQCNIHIVLAEAEDAVNKARGPREATADGDVDILFEKPCQRLGLGTWTQPSGSPQYAPILYTAVLRPPSSRARLLHVRCKLRLWRKLRMRREVWQRRRLRCASGGQQVAVLAGQRFHRRAAAIRSGCRISLLGLHRGLARLPRSGTKRRATNKAGRNRARTAKALKPCDSPLMCEERRRGEKGFTVQRACERLGQTQRDKVVEASGIVTLGVQVRRPTLLSPRACLPELKCGCRASRLVAHCLAAVSRAACSWSESRDLAAGLR